MHEPELDVRQLAKPDKHPAIFATYDSLPAGGSFVLVNNRDPRHLRDEFEAGHPGSYRWEYLEPGPRVWRIRIGKLTSTPLPRVLANTSAIASRTDAPDAVGTIWSLQTRDRDLDSAVVALAPHDRIAAYSGPDLDTLIHVLSGSGRLTAERGTVELHRGDLLWLPRRSVRKFIAGPDGLRYLEVHQHRQLRLLDARKAV